MRYFHPTSLTWWAGLLAVLTGGGALLLPDQGQLAELARLVAILAGAGDDSPMTLITLGLGLIGLRDRIERGFRWEGR
jgi:hypothetical protein